MIRQTLNGHHMGTRQLADWHNAGINRFITDPALCQFADHDGAGTAVTRRTAFFGTGQSGGSQVLEGGPVGWFISLDRLPVNR